MHTIIIKHKIYGTGDSHMFSMLLLICVLIGIWNCALSLNEDSALQFASKVTLKEPELPKMHIVWLDTRPKHSLLDLVSQQLPLVLNQVKDFDIRATLFTSNNTLIPNHIKSLIASQSLNLEYVQSGLNGHIGKAYVLRHSVINRRDSEVVMLFDGDVRLCPGWLRPIQQWWRREYTDVLWTLAPAPYGGYMHRESGLAVSPEITDSIENLTAFRNFGERNSGTVFVLRTKNPLALERWFTNALSLYDELVRRKYTFEKDQPAFRESFFLQMRAGELSETIVPHHVGCRFNITAACGCVCSCSSCLFTHNNAHRRMWNPNCFNGSEPAL